MKKAFSLLLLILLLTSCGNKEAATGGPEDSEKPTIITVYPPEFTDITGKQLEITFSKPMDLASLATGLQIFPKIDSKRYRWDGNTLIIDISETLMDDTNYLFTFSDKIRCFRNNPLDKQYNFTWAKGNFTDHRISGSFTFENIEDSSSEVRVSLFTADSTLISTRRFSENYSFDSLDNRKHFLRAFIDKNKNNRLDVESEPFAEALVEAQPLANIDLFLVYEDSNPPALKSVIPVFIDEIDLVFDENIVSLDTVHLLTDSLSFALRIKRWRQKNDQVKIFTAEMDTVDYKILVFGAKDKKGNKTLIDSLVFSGITKKDTSAPKVIKIEPRDGASVNSLKPEIKITFSKVLFREDAKAWLTETETGLQYPLKAVSGDHEVFTFQTFTNLKNFNSYRIELEAKDPRGNQLSGYESSIFIPIVNTN